MQLGLDALYRLYETADGWMCLAAILPGHWTALLKALGQPSWGDDSRFADGPSRARHRPDLEALLAPIFRSRPSGELFDLLDDHGVPCEIADPHFAEQIFDDDEAKSLGLVVEQQHPKLGRFDHYGTSIYFSDTPGRIWGPPPVCGQHTREILRDHGFADTEIDELIGAKAIFEELWVD